MFDQIRGQWFQVWNGVIDLEIIAFEFSWALSSLSFEVFEIEYLVYDNKHGLTILCFHSLGNCYFCSDQES